MLDRIETIEQRKKSLRFIPRIACDPLGCSKVLLGNGVTGVDAAAKRGSLQASAVTRATQPDSESASVAKFAIVGVCPEFSESWMAPPHPPV